VASPAAPGADAAYDRAVAAYQQGAYDVARQWALEALAQDAEHARARALLGRLDSVRRPAAAPQTPASGRPAYPQAAGPEVVSTDPTVLINRASRGPKTEQPIEPTVLIRPEARQRRAEADPFVAPVAAPRPAAATSEPTVIVQRSPYASAGAGAPPADRVGASSQSRVAAGSAGEGFLDRLLRRRPGRPKAPGAPAARGVLIALGAVAAAALLVVVAIVGFRWFWPAGVSLTLTKPTGGTILGPGLECGTRGTDCTISGEKGSSVELVPQPDDNYVFSGFTGDCAPAGRVMLSEARTCGATFDRVSAAAPAVTFPLTITKPTGGTIIGAGGILCGTLGTTCTADIPNGQPVTLHFEADAGYTFLAFTGECSANGEATMTSAKTCGATFTQTSTSVARGVSSVESSRPRRTRAPAEAAPPPSSAKPVPPPAPPAAAASPVAPPIAVPPPPASSPAQAPVSTDKPAAPPISAEDHAKNEIQQLVNDYCSSLETLDPNRVKALWPLAPMATLKAQFRTYKSLRCTITAPPKFDRLDASAAGGAQVKFGLKQQIQGSSGGAPEEKEMEITMVVSRMNFQSAWRIDRILAVEKPKS
jgi:hypothetical protein